MSASSNRPRTRAEASEVADGMPRGGRLRPCRAPGAAGNRPQRFTPRVFRQRVLVASSHRWRFEPRSGCRLEVAARRADTGRVRAEVDFPACGAAAATRHAISDVRTRTLTSAGRVSSSAAAIAGPTLHAGPTDSCRSACRRRCPRFPCEQRRPTRSTSRQGSAGSIRRDQVARALPSGDNISVRRGEPTVNTGGPAEAEHYDVAEARPATQRRS